MPSSTRSSRRRAAAPPMSDAGRDTASSSSRHSHEHQPPGWARPSLALLPLVCVALGGGVERWSQGIVLFVLGAVLLAAPPRGTLGRGLNLILAALLLLSLTAFLPANWLGLPAWRRTFVEDFGAALPSTLSAQPWLSAESCAVFLAGIAWLYLLATLPWRSGERRRAGVVFAVGVAILAGTFLGVARSGIDIPIWHNPRHFGPFPNRNQTANFLAVGALPILALARAAWRGGRVVPAIGWLVGWLTTAAAVLQCFSRAGVAILFVTTAVYLGLEFVRANRRQAATHDEARFAPWRRIALLASLLMVAASVVLLVGGDTLARLRLGGSDADLNAVSDALRLRIQQDAAAMTVSAPWCGVGLGNFAGLFEIFRHASAYAPLRSIHPESDWLWLATEMGWPAVLLALAGCALLGQRLWPDRHAHDRPLRLAAAIGVIAFAAHSFFEVSTHRFGTAMCGIFLLGLALPGGAGDAVATERSASPRWMTPVFRVAGLLLLAVGTVWLLEAGGWISWPGAQAVARLKSLAIAQGRARDYAGAGASATRALAWAPLDWELYFVRAGAGVYEQRDLDATEADFRRARFLERCSPGEPADESRLWASVQATPQAVHALLEACRRDPAHAGDYIGPVYLTRLGDHDFLDGLGSAVLRNPSLATALVEHLEGGDVATFVARVLQADPDLARLDNPQKARFFRAWGLKGDPRTLADDMASRPAWQSLGWRWWAEACGRLGTPEGWQQACKLVAPHVSQPAVPSLSDPRSLSQLQRDAANAPDDPALTLALYRAQSAVGDSAGALTTLHRMTRRSDAPAYFSYLEARLATESAQWETAWEAWQRYFTLTNGNKS